MNNEYGIRLKSSDNNSIFSNMIKGNKFGLYVCCNSNDNILYGNSFMQNSEQNACDYVTNQWDNGIVGNYWDDYVDKYPNATDGNNDSIWDIPYEITCGSGHIHIIYGKNVDRFPQMKARIE